MRVPSVGVSTWRTMSIGTRWPSGAVAHSRTDVYARRGRRSGVGVRLTTDRSPVAATTSKIVSGDVSDWCDTRSVGDSHSAFWPNSMSCGSSPKSSTDCSPVRVRIRIRGWASFHSWRAR